MRIVHLSDIHVWRYTWDPRRLVNRRLWGILELLRGRARRYRLERIEGVVERARGLDPDHVLITGDLTTTALPAEFLEVRRALEPLLADPLRTTLVPGNHDRTTGRSLRSRRFEQVFAAFLPAPTFPWLRRLGADTAILGLDPTRSRMSPRGVLPPEQLAAARALLAGAEGRPRRLIVACHYPVAAPPPYRRELEAKRLKNEAEVRAWVATLGPHLYCCGHVHAAWAYAPPDLPGHLSLNAGAPLLSDPTGLRLPGFLEIQLDGRGVTVIHHAWDGAVWMVVPLFHDPDFFAPLPAPAHTPSV
jgi:3',5'-cyclic AMP phosphodiesterase CpdA